ncbi:MAG: SusC/RagA family TonB-linked outer membrane protein, partial [Prevotella sp.]|nr:SusC/RagA family TonB-linked outer membrane protein [Prevotella sp.]
NVQAGKTLVFSYIGMQTKEAAAKNNMYVELGSDETQLDEVIVVAFGTAKKSAFTGSAKVINSDKLAQSQVTSVTSALAGAVPGVTLTSSNGGPDQSPTIRIRGFGSLNAGKDPLIIVDGAPYSGDMNTLNPNDVESMTVLKDAASSALYGARGANGVIIITTKQAKKGQDAVVTFDAKWGANTRALQHYDVISSPAQYYEMQYEALKNYYVNRGASPEQAWMTANGLLTGAPDQGGLGYNIWTIPQGQYLIGTDGRLNPNATLGYVSGDYFLTPDDWEDVGTRTGLRQEYNMSINGSSERSNFYMSLGYLDNEGIALNSDFKRLSARLRGDYQVKDWFKVGGNLSYARFDSNSLGNNGSSASSGNVWAFTTQMAPIYPAYVRNADGSIKIDDNGFKVMDYGNGMNANCDRPFIQDANPIMDVMLNTRNYEGNASTGGAFADITFMPGLVLSLKGSYNLDETRGTYVYNKYYGQFDSTGGTVSKYHQRSYSYNLQQLLNYTTTIGKYNNLNVMLGHEYYNSSLSYLSASKSKMFSDDNKELAGAVVDGKSAYSYKSEYNNEGWFGRIQYDYDQRIFGSASYRRDASSRFHSDNRWGSFWSLGGAWILSKENWFESSWVDMLKVKASIGSQGNDNIGSYRYTDQYVINNSDGEVGTSFYLKGNKDITWETQTNFNTGIEFELFKRLTGSVEYYYRKTTDMLMSYSTAPSIGYTSYYANVGDMYNTGIEFDFKYNIIRNKNVNWDVTLNLGTIKNRVSKLDDEHKNSSYYTADGKKVDGYTDGSFFIAEGQSIYTWRIKDYAGVDQETGEAMWYKNVFETDADGNNITDANGEKIWKGRETTKEYSEADYYLTEKTTVPKVQGGFGTQVRFYGFDLSINCSFQLGGKGYDSSYAQFMAAPTNQNGGYNFHKDLLDSWTVDNPSATIPRFQYDDLYFSSSSTRFLTSSDYLNIDNINLGYTLPSSLTKKFQVNSLRLYVACENVGYFSKRKGFDPRQGYSGSANATTYSPMRTISGGITVQF